MSKGKKRTDVGYKNPPKEHQFKKGHSGNKKGRPRGSRNYLSAILDALNDTVPITDHTGKTSKIPVMDAIFKRMVIDAMKGNPRARDLVLEFAEKFAKNDPDNKTTPGYFEKKFSQLTDKQLDDLIDGLILAGAKSDPRIEAHKEIHGEGDGKPIFRKK